MLHGDLSDGQMRWLYSHDKIKCLINIAHGEGFGLPMFEAAQSALPIATIGWSGQMDYLVQENKEYFAKIDHKLEKIGEDAVWEHVLQPESRWAYAESGSFKMQIRKLKKNWKKYKKQAEKLQSLIVSKHQEQVMYAKFCEALDLKPTSDLEEIDEA